MNEQQPPPEDIAGLLAHLREVAHAAIAARVPPETAAGPLLFIMGMIAARCEQADLNELTLLHEVAAAEQRGTVRSLLAHAMNLAEMVRHDMQP